MDVGELNRAIGEKSYTLKVIPRSSTLVSQVQTSQMLSLQTTGKRLSVAYLALFSHLRANVE